MPTGKPPAGQAKCLIFFHGNPWDGVPARQRYLMEALSNYIPVIWLDNSGSKRGKFSSFSPRKNITVLQGVIPFWIAMKLRGLEALALPVVRGYLKWFCREYQHRVFWSMDNWLLAHRGVPCDRYVFDCMDPIFSDDADQIREYDRREKEVLSRAHKVFASAETLVSRCREHHRDVTLLNNACAPEEYDAELIRSAVEPGWWPGTNKPVAAFLGTIDWRFDFAMAEQACRDHPHVHFVLAGAIAGPFANRTAQIAALPNVTVPGRISVEDGRYLLSRCAIGLIPFTPGPMNDAVNPVKMYAYALMGKPIAGSAVRELQIRPHIAMTGATPAAFSAAVSDALKHAQDGGFAARLRNFACQNTWEVRAAQAWEQIKDL